MLLKAALPLLVWTAVAARDRHSELPEVVVYPQDRPVLHMLGYVREYSTLSTYSDTVFLYREKAVDFMLPSSRAAKSFTGWTAPRVLASRSCYRFTDIHGLDSVSDSFGAHFSWSDWIELPAPARLPAILAGPCRGSSATPSLAWRRDSCDVSVRADALAETLGRSWAPSLTAACAGWVDFGRISVECRFTDVDGETVEPSQLASYTLHVESEGRGRDLSRMFRGLGQVRVETRAELYITDRRHIPLKEARRLGKHPPRLADSDIAAPDGTPPPGAGIDALVARVSGIDRDLIRRELVPDSRLAGIDDLFKTRRNTWQQFWDMICPPRYSINVTAAPSTR